MGMQRLYSLLEEFRRRVPQYARQGSLHERVAAYRPLAEALQSSTNLFIKYLVSVMNYNPAHPPSRNQKPFREATARQYWDFTCERC